MHLTAGLRPPSTFGGGGSSGGGVGQPSTFRPAIFKPAAAAAAEAAAAAPMGSRRGSTEEDPVQPGIPQGGAAGDEFSAPVNRHNAWQAKGAREQQPAVQGRPGQHHTEQQQPGSARSGADAVSAAALDPAVQEVLAHWYYYRGRGFEPDAMAEWVRQVSKERGEGAVHVPHSTHTSAPTRLLRRNRQKWGPGQGGAASLRRGAV